MPEGCNGRAQRLPAKIGAVLPAHILQFFRFDSDAPKSTSTRQDEPPETTAPSAPPIPLKFMMLMNARSSTSTPFCRFSLDHSDAKRGCPNF